MNYLYLIVQLFMFVFIFIISLLLVRTVSFLAKEKRINKYTVEALSDRPISFIEKIQRLYIGIIKKMSKFIGKSKVFSDYSLKYDKYVMKTNSSCFIAIDYISRKFVFGFVTVILTIISDVLRFKMFTFWQIVISFLVGFFILDVFIYFKKKRTDKQIENDLLKAVIIMNNAFKSNRSIMQAVELVSIELEGPIGYEFRKMFIDLSYGLELQVVFDRFASRVKLEEVKYMASSLVILNKTGGKVTKIFSSIERSFIERKKVKDEMNSTLALSKYVFNVLVSIPFIISILIFFMDPTYFTIFITNPYGNIMLVCIIIIYVLYIIIVRKIVRIRE